MFSNSISLVSKVIAAPISATCFRTFLKVNRYFLNGFLIFLLLSLIVLSQTQVGDSLLWTNANRNRFLDQFFIYGTTLGEEVGYIGLMLVLLLVRYRSAICLPFIGLAVTLIAYYLKGYFDYARPVPHFKLIGELEQLNLIEGVKIYEGWNSFPSGHAMAGFALFSFASFCVDKKYKNVVGPIFLLLAVVVGFSRVYLLHHFMRDIIFGASLGIVIGMIFYFLQFQIFPCPHKWMDKHLCLSQSSANGCQSEGQH